MGITTPFYREHQYYTPKFTEFQGIFGINEIFVNYAHFLC